MVGPRTGLLLVNLGTPASPGTSDVRAYLREFLSDPRVIDIHPLKRWLLLNLIILRFRPRQSAEAYAKIWTDRGSPLLYHARDLVEKVRLRLDAEVTVGLGMRYGRPSIASALEELRSHGVQRLVVFPMYPQFSSATTGSSIEKVLACVSALWNVPSLHVVPPFYDHPAFIEASAAVARPHVERPGVEKVFFSFHGLPERHLRKSDPTGSHCMHRDDCCDRIVDAIERKGLATNTVIMLTSDHGDMLGDFDLLGKNTFFEPAIHVPLIIRAPDRPASTDDTLVTLTDLFATILTLASVTRNDDGDSIVLPQFGGDGEARRAAPVIGCREEGRTGRTISEGRQIQVAKPVVAEGRNALHDPGGAADGGQAQALRALGDGDGREDSVRRREDVGQGLGVGGWVVQTSRADGREADAVRLGRRINGLRERDGFARIGFGECRGIIQPAVVS